jgi:uncharacterized protein YbjQ (UPF0145 family)/DNA-directed RNA polymerase subunit RPC12/RpoP
MSTEQQNDVDVVCPKCKQELLVDAALLGTMVQCPRCQQRVVVGRGAARPPPPRNIIVTTTPNIEGQRIAQYLGVVSAQVVAGVNALRDALTGLTDIFGGRSKTLEQAIEQARWDAVRELKQRAASEGADAVLGVRIDLETGGASNGMMIVVATGTAVRLKELNS